MARSQSSTALKVIGACAAVIAGGAGFGYLFGSVREAHPPVQPAQTPVSSTLTPPPALSPSSIHPRTTNGNYTAPGAPRITIEEESQPILRRPTPPPTPAADPEATQEAAPITPKPAVNDAVPTDTTNSSPNGSATAASTTPESTTGSPTSVPPSPPPAPTDPDFEHVNSSPKPPPSTSDPENGQQGGSGDKTQGDRQPDATKVQFRVQTGAYTDESNARSVADTLRSEGYSTSTRSERDGDHLVYKVQVGAYHSKNGASKAADDLQKKGYPAFISAIGP